MKFSARDMWNAVEFGLFYRQPLGWKLEKFSVFGHKKDKTQIKFFECCNADGYEKMPLMVIGTVLNPRPFKKNSGQELGFDYHAKKKALMNTGLLYGWQIRFDNNIGRKKGQKMSFLI